MPEKNNRVLGTFAALGSAFAYGIYPILAKFAILESINNPTVLFLRFGGCIIVMWTYVIVTHKVWRLPWRKVLLLIGLGVSAYGLNSALNLYAISRISASLASLILCAYPVFVTITMLLFKQETLTVNKAISLVSCIIGLTFLLQVSDAQFDTLGILLALGACLAYTSYVVLGSVLNKGIDPIVAGTYIMTGVVIIYAIFGFTSSSISFDLSRDGWVIIALLAVVSTALPVMFFWSAVRHIGAVNASIIGCVEPLTTVLLEMAIFHVHLQSQQYVGAMLLIGGIILLQIQSSKKSQQVL